MQVGVVVTGFTDIDGQLFITLTAYVAKGGRVQQASGSVPFAATNQEARAYVKELIFDNFGIQVGNNASYRVIGL